MRKPPPRPPPAPDPTIELFERAVSALEVFATAYARWVETQEHPPSNGGGSVEQKLDRIITQGDAIMSFAQDVLAKITAQTTIIASIKAWIQNLPTDVVSAEDKAAILANLDANSAELETAIPTNVPPVG